MKNENFTKTGLLSRILVSETYGLCLEIKSGADNILIPLTESQIQDLPSALEEGHAVMKNKGLHTAVPSQSSKSLH